MDDRDAIKDLDNWLLEQIETTEAELLEASTIAPNSYAHGYEGGHLMALRLVLDEIRSDGQSDG